jgi:hypothetical protein
MVAHPASIPLAKATAFTTPLKIAQQVTEIVIAISALRGVTIRLIQPAVAVK